MAGHTQIHENGYMRQYYAYRTLEKGGKGSNSGETTYLVPAPFVLIVWAVVVYTSGEIGPVLIGWFLGSCYRSSRSKGNEGK